MNRKIIIAFLVGLAIGVVGVIVGRPYVGERLPEAVGGKRQTLQGPVTAKRREADRLLLTVSTPSGAILATFKKKLGEIDLLVERGDSVSLAVPGYQPFLQDPEITRVAKPAGVVGQPAEGPEVEPSDADPSEAEADTLQAEESRGDSLQVDTTGRWYD